MEQTVKFKVWATRDEDGHLEWCEDKPSPVRTTPRFGHKKRCWAWEMNTNGSTEYLPPDWFPDVTWSDGEPRKATITIAVKRPPVAQKR